MFSYSYSLINMDKDIKNKWYKQVYKQKYVFNSSSDFRACLVYRGQKVKKVPKTAEGGCYKAILRMPKIISIYSKKTLMVGFSSIIKALRGW